MLAVPSTISCARAAVDVGDRRAGEELEVVHRLREAGPQLAAAGDAPGGEEVLPGRLVLGQRDVERAAEPGGGRDEGESRPVEVRERRVADRRERAGGRAGSP